MGIEARARLMIPTNRNYVSRFINLVTRSFAFERHQVVGQQVRHVLVARQS